jgi:PAS domain S-box-containing protein
MFDLLMAMSSEGIFVVQKGRIRECNAFLRRLGGYRREEVLDTLFASYFNHESMAAVESICEAPAAGAEPVCVPEAFLVRKNGERLRVCVKAQPSVFSGAPAVLVVVSEAPERSTPGPWDAIPEGHLLLEEMPPGVPDWDPV